MKSVRIFVSILIFLSSFLVIQAQEQMPSVTIRFYDKTVYYPGNGQENPVLIRVTISNNTSDTMRFKLADNRIFSMDFNVVNSKNIRLEHTEEFIRKRSTNQPVFFREISLEPGEEYSFIENIKDYIEIPQSGIYYMDGYFYPELNRQTVMSSDNPYIKPVKSNRLTLEVRPSVGAASLSIVPTDPVTFDNLSRKQISPDQVITDTIIARQRNSWDEFFLYMDLEEMILRDSSLAKKFISESEDGRIRMIENYKISMRNKSAALDIIMVPNKFQIEKTAYTPTEGSVSVIQWFDYSTYSEKKRYTYYLHQKDGIWLIYDYTVDNLGTE
ncbi:MAG: hypothetical protein IAA81_02105 [Spirochaetes bacterium]|uniref:Uncharacterized protein n=1 Tax=Candidatus Gallitreponema excrementavium TaxID=2840840 RepID=A0A9D9HNE0_9SPIR|nr:hypothetical protein [Candidatus Gallitreponema excrementavium]